MEIMEPKEAWGRLHTQEVHSSNLCVPTTLQGISTKRATHVLPRKLVIRASWKAASANKTVAWRHFEGVMMPVSPTESTTSGLHCPHSWMLAGVLTPL